MVTSKLEAILGEEQVAILAGRYEELPALQEKKEIALRELRRTGTATELLNSISTKIERNQSLLSAAIKGVSAARGRLETLTKSVGSLTTYDQAGAVHQLAHKDSGLEKKA